MIYINVIEVKAKFLDPFSKGKASRMLTHHQITGFDAN
jgi:hypothetical protein